MSHWWISKGDSNFCSELIYDDESDKMVKDSPCGFYDIVSTQDTVEGGIHVVDHKLYEKAIFALLMLQAIYMDHGRTNYDLAQIREIIQKGLGQK